MQSLEQTGELCAYCGRGLTEEQLDAGKVSMTKVDGKFRLVHDPCHEQRLAASRSHTDAEEVSRVLPRESLGGVTHFPHEPKGASSPAGARA